MTHTRVCTVFLAALCIFSTIAVSSPNEQIAGVSVIELSSPITPQLRETQKNLAMDSLSRYISFWINEFFDNCLHPDNGISLYFLDRFIANTKEHAGAKAYVEGRKFITSVTVPPKAFDSIIVAHNAYYDSLAYHYWDKTRAAQHNSTDPDLFKTAVPALFYSMAHIGSPLVVPGDPAETKLTNKTQSIVHTLLTRLDFSFSNPVITGTPPEPPRNQVDIYINIDSLPVPGLSLAAFRPDGRKVTTVQTNAEGVASLARMKVPFVAHGAFLYLRPSLAGFIDPSLYFDPAFFGLQLSGISDQTLIFNIIKPRYSLEYSVVSVNQMAIPASFSEITTMHKFLTDSCHLQKAGAGENADIAFTIHSQVSNYLHDDKEQNHLKVESKITIAELKPGGAQIEKIEVVNDRYYEIRSKIPVGLFFWESTQNLRKLIRETLDEL